MFQNAKVRFVLSFVLGACAGLSLCVSVLPLVLFQAKIGDEATLAYLLTRFAPHVMLIWAIGGWAAARTGFVLGGGLVLGTTGLATGLFLMFAALHPSLKILAVGGVTGLLYGFLGGMILARVLAAPGPAEEDES
jgi:hypothetical protein